MVLLSIVFLKENPLSPRTTITALLCGAALSANAQVVYSNVNATYTLNPAGGSFNWTAIPNGAEQTIDFVGMSPAFKVGAGTGFSTGTSIISYDVTAVNPVGSLSMVLQGNVIDFGRITYTTTVTSGSTTLATFTGTILGDSYTGGVDGAFTLPLNLSFSAGSSSFTVTNSFSLDINGQSLPSTSIATLGLVEQNLRPVPEPATLSALGLGALALIRRRRMR